MNCVSVYICPGPLKCCSDNYCYNDLNCTGQAYYSVINPHYNSTNGTSSSTWKWNSLDELYWLFILIPILCVLLCCCLIICTIICIRKRRHHKNENKDKIEAQNKSMEELSQHLPKSSYNEHGEAVNEAATNDQV